MNRLGGRFNKLYSYLVSFVMMICIIASSTLILSTTTLCDYKFLFKHFTDRSVIVCLADELGNNLAELSNQTGIPADVFMNVSDQKFLANAQDTIIRDMRSGNETNFYAVSNLRDRYQKAIIQYYSENNIEINENRAEAISNAAVDIFNETCVVKNNADIAELVVPIDKWTIFSAVACLILFIIGIILEYYLNNKRHKSFSYVAMTLMSAGGIMTVLPGAILYNDVHVNLGVTNVEAYNMAIANALETMLLYVIAIGAVLIISSAALFISNDRYYKAKLMAFDIEDEITQNLIIERDE